MGKDQTERIWRREGLNIPKSQKSPERCGSTTDLACGGGRSGPITSGLYDFISAVTDDGRSVRKLNPIGRRECLAIPNGA